MIRIMMPTTCEYDGCGKPATRIASGRKADQPNPAYHDVGLFCEDHGKMVAQEDSPEYLTTCPNCSCVFGVN